MTAPQVTIAGVELCIASEHYFTAAGAVRCIDFCAGEHDKAVEPGSSLDMLTICVLVATNGHTVTGESYCADPAKFNAETGRIEARKAAINKLWPMVVYAERERLASARLVGHITPERLTELREAMRTAPPMPIFPLPKPADPWTVINPYEPASWPPKGEWLVTVETDGGREVHVLQHEGLNRWRHEGEFTFEHGYLFRPIAWAARPEAYAGEVPG